MHFRTSTFFYLIAALITALALFFLFQPTKSLDSPIPSNAFSALNEKTSGSGAEILTPTAKELPLSTEELIKQASTAESEKNWSLAVSSYSAAFQKDSNNITILIKRGKALMNLKKFDLALQDFSKVLQSQPKDRTVQLLLAEVRLHQIDSIDNKELIADAMARLGLVNPPNARSAFLECMIHVAEEADEKVEATCGSVAKNFANTQEQSVAQSFLDHLGIFSTFKDGNRTYLNTLQAKTMSEAGFYELSSALLKHVLESNRNYRDAWTLLGYNYLVQNKYSLAQVALESANSLDPSKAYIQFLLATTFDKLGNSAKAIPLYASALRNQYTPAEPLRRRLATLYVDTSEYNLALEQYTKILEETKATSPDDYIKPMWLYIDIVKKPNEALLLARKIKLQFPTNAMSENMLGWAYQALKDTKNAETHLKLAISMDATLAAPYLNLSKLYLATQDLERAKQYAKDAYEKGKNTSVATAAAEIYNHILHQASQKNISTPH